MMQRAAGEPVFGARPCTDRLQFPLLRRDGGLHVLLLRGSRVQMAEDVIKARLYLPWQGSAVGSLPTPASTCGTLCSCTSSWN